MKKAGHLILLLLLLALSSCHAPKDLVYKDIGNFSIKQKSNGPTAVSLDIRLYNPNKYSLKLKTADVDVFLNGNHLGKMTVNESISLSALTTSAIPVLLDVDLVKVLPNALQLFLNSEVNIKLSGTLKAGRHGIFIAVPINYEGKQDLLGRSR